MLNISMVRVDERLVHGQIIIKWIEAKKANKIVIVDDEAASDPIMGKVLKMTLPKGIGLDMYALQEGINYLITNDSEDSVIVLVKDLWVVKQIYEKGVKMKEINIGRIPSDVGKKMVYNNVFLSDRDIEAINFFRDEGVPVVVQIVPDSKPVDIYDLEL